MEFTLALPVNVCCGRCKGNGTLKNFPSPGSSGPVDCPDCQGKGKQDQIIFLDASALGELRQALTGKWKCPCGAWFTPSITGDDVSGSTGYCSSTCFEKYESHHDEELRPAEPIIDYRTCSPMTQEERVRLQRDPWRLDQLRNNVPPGRFYCERCGKHLPRDYAKAHKPFLLPGQSICQDCGTPYDLSQGGVTLCPGCLDAQASAADTVCEDNVAEDPYEPPELNRQLIDVELYR